VTWSTSGAAATYPTTTPVPGSDGYFSALTFRLDPGSRVVYVVGNWGALIVPSRNVPNIWRDPLPAEFRPLVAVTLFPRSGNYEMTINPDGTAPAFGLQNGNANLIRDFYFTDTSPA
jgi:hypothetical protein